MMIIAGGVWKYKHRSIPVTTAPHSAQLEQARKHINQQRYDLALPVLTKLAEQGEVKAYLYLGIVHQSSIQFPGVNGKYIAADPVKAEYWFEKAAQSGDLPAQLLLARKYSRSAKPAEAAKWYEAAAAQNDPDAQYHMGLLAEVTDERRPEDYIPPDNWAEYKSQIDQGIAPTRVRGKDLAQHDYTGAAKWYAMAASQGSGGALFRLGKLYMNGQGVTPNKVTAYALFVLSGQKHKEDPSIGGAFWADEYRDKVGETLSDAEKNQAQQLAISIKNGSAIPL